MDCRIWIMIIVGYINWIIQVMQYCCGTRFGSYWGLWWGNDYQKGNSEQWTVVIGSHMYFFWIHYTQRYNWKCHLWIFIFLIQIDELDYLMKQKNAAFFLSTVMKGNKTPLVDKHTNHPKWWQRILSLQLCSFSRIRKDRPKHRP